MSETVDWSKLPVELVSVITKKLPDLPDFTRARAVCRTWGSTPLSSCPPQLPWLIELKDPAGPLLEREQQFYCLSSGETGTICVEESHQGKYFRGPCKGYLLLLGEEGGSYRVSLFNPLTRSEISLPRIGTDYFWPVWISANQTANEVAFVNHELSEPEERGLWAYHPPDSNEWISMEGIFKNCCYWNSMFFSTKGWGEDTKVFDVTSKKLLHEIPPPEGEIALSDRRLENIAYLIESSEEILRVSCYIDWRKIGTRNFEAGELEAHECVFLIHRLDFQGGKGRPCWIKINSIGDQIIFLEELNGFSISAKPFNEFRGNCIYFVHYFLDKPHRYDIETGAVGIVPCPFEMGSWFVPSLQ